jgi:RES domain-containing protein
MIPPAVDINQSDTVRLIPTGRLKQPVMLPLAENQGALDDLAALEGATNQRLQTQERGLPELHPRELAYNRPGALFINAAFTHTRRGGNRFNNENRGAWYCAFTAEAALAEVEYHLTRELAAIGRYENTTPYTELLADFVGKFHVVDGNVVPRPACLDPDPAVGYPAGQALAAEIQRIGGNGLVYPSVRHAGGTCLVAFHPALVQNFREGGIWQLEWQGQPKPNVTRLTK